MDESIYYKYNIYIIYIVVFLIRQLLSVLIQSLDEKIGSGWQPLPIIDGEKVEFERKWVNPAAAPVNYSNIIPQSFKESQKAMFNRIAAFMDWKKSIQCV